MRNSLSQSSMLLLPGPPVSPHTRPPQFCCSVTTQQRLAQVMLVALVLAALMLLYLIAHAGDSTATAAVAESSSLGTELPPLPVSPHPASRWSDLTPPLSRESLGQATWSFLHTMAAVYPEQPNELEQRAARQLLEALGWLYPCAVCADHFRSTLSARPPTVGSRRELSGWLCEVHNEVNGRLDKLKSVASTPSSLSAHQTSLSNSQLALCLSPPLTSNMLCLSVLPPLVAESSALRSERCGRPNCGNAAAGPRSYQETAQQPVEGWVECVISYTHVHIIFYTACINTLCAIRTAPARGSVATVSSHLNEPSIA